jgi:hypothetical protein
LSQEVATRWFALGLKLRLDTEFSGDGFTWWTKTAPGPIEPWRKVSVKAEAMEAVAAATEVRHTSKDLLGLWLAALAFAEFWEGSEGKEWSGVEWNGDFGGFERGIA